MMPTEDINTGLMNLKDTINRLISERQEISNDDPRAFLIDLNITRMQQEHASKYLEKRKSITLQNDVEKYNYLLKQFEKIKMIRKDYSDLNVRKEVIYGLTPQDVMYFETHNRQLDNLTVELFKDFDHDLSIDEIKDMIDRLNFEFIQLNMPIDKLVSSKPDMDKSKQLLEEINLLQQEKDMREKADELRRRIKAIENLPGEALTPEIENRLTDLDYELGNLLAEHDDIIRVITSKGLKVTDLDDKRRELSSIYNKYKSVERTTPGAGGPGAGGPGAGGPGAGSPGAGSTGAGGPGTGNPGAGGPGTGKPGAGGPGAGGPGTGKPSAGGPSAGSPGAGSPGAGSPGAGHVPTLEPKMDATGNIYADLNKFNYYPTTTESTFSYVRRIIEDNKEKLIYKTESIEPYLNNPEKHLVRLVKDMCKDKDLSKLSNLVQYDNNRKLSNVLSKKRDLVRQMRNLSADQQIYKYVALKSAVTPEQIAEALKPNYTFDYNICYDTKNPNIFRGTYRFFTGKDVHVRQIKENGLTTKKDNSFIERYRRKHSTYSYAPREQTKSKGRDNVER
jgi:hypothetical protein